jgi:hypothetical protein
MPGPQTFPFYDFLNNLPKNSITQYRDLIKSSCTDQTYWTDLFSQEFKREPPQGDYSALFSVLRFEPAAMKIWEKISKDKDGTTEADFKAAFNAVLSSQASIPPSQPVLPASSQTHSGFSYNIKDVAITKESADDCATYLNIQPNPSKTSLEMLLAHPKLSRLSKTSAPTSAQILQAAYASIQPTPQPPSQPAAEATPAADLFKHMSDFTEKITAMATKNATLKSSGTFTPVFDHTYNLREDVVADIKANKFIELYRLNSLEDISTSVSADINGLLSISNRKQLVNTDPHRMSQAINKIASVRRMLCPSIATSDTTYINFLVEYISPIVTELGRYVIDRTIRKSAAECEPSSPHYNIWFPISPETHLILTTLCIRYQVENPIIGCFNCGRNDHTRDECLLMLVDSSSSPRKRHNHNDSTSERSPRKRRKNLVTPKDANSAVPTEPCRNWNEPTKGCTFPGCKRIHGCFYCLALGKTNATCCKQKWPP